MTFQDASQLSNLRNGRRLITSHNGEGQAIIHSSQDFKWQSYDNSQMAFSVLYTTSSFPPDLTNETDITTNEALTQRGVGLVNPNGTILRCVDFAPGYRCLMHRTQSLDYGIVMEGDIDMVLDSGEKERLGRGDVAVQRATMHSWVNASETEWARMMFVLQDCKPLEVGGQKLGEDLGEGRDLVPPSGN